MPYYNDAPGDVEFATNRSNDPTKGMSSRAGATISEKDALEELAARRASMPITPSSSASLTPQATSGDDSEKAALGQLQQRRAASQEASIGPSNTFDERFDAAPEMEPGAMAKQMIAQKGFGGAITPFFQNQLQRLVRENPGVATTMAVGMNLPIAAAATYYGGRYGIPFAMRNLERIGLGGLGIEQIYQHGPDLLKLIRSNP